MKIVKYLVGLLVACIYLIALPIVAIIAVLTNLLAIVSLGGSVVFDIKCREKSDKQ